MRRFADAPSSLDWERATALRAHAPATHGDIRSADRTLLSWGRYSIVYAPFDGAWNANAKLVLLGLTPGMTQALAANAIALDYIRAFGTVNWHDLSIWRRERVAFKGTMKLNLVRMLDAVGLPEHMDVESTAALFESTCGLAQMASALRYPVFRGARNYSGGRSIVRAPFLRDILDRLLAQELASVPDALVIPFGPSVELALDYLADRGAFSTHRMIRGFPHPSGANPRRPSVFARNRNSIAEQLDQWFHRGRIQISHANALGGEHT